jgi:hypothetical protein
MKCFQTALAYFVKTISYVCEMFMKSTPIVTYKNTFTKIG